MEGNSRMKEGSQWELVEKEQEKGKGGKEWRGESEGQVVHRHGRQKREIATWRREF